MAKLSAKDCDDAYFEHFDGIVLVFSGEELRNNDGPLQQADMIGNAFEQAFIEWKQRMAKKPKPRPKPRPGC